MKKIRVLTPVTLGLAACLWLQSCTNPPQSTTESAVPSQSKLTFSGANTIASIVSEVAEPYKAAHPDVQIDVQTTNSWRGVADARQGIADIGMVNRELKTEEQQNLSAFTIAKDGITVIIHQDNPLKSLTNQQIVDIYTDKINNWKQVGGKDAPIIVASRVESGAALEFFSEYFKIQPSAIRADVVAANTQESMDAVAGNPNAIGYASVGNAESAAASGTAIKLLPINGVAASIDNINNGTFPITRPLNLVTKNPPSTLVRDFIDFVQSSEGQNIVKKKNFVPVSP